MSGGQTVASGNAASGLCALKFNGMFLSVQYRTNRQVTPFCEKANELLRRHDAALEESGRIHIVRLPFRADPRMSDVFLL
jgi:hypothetical protein